MKRFLEGLMAIVSFITVGAAPSENYVVHEWGTFTSVQGADGEQMVWKSVSTEDLPQFVYQTGSNGQLATASVLPTSAGSGKASMLARQRLETPVIYFYSSHPRRAEVEVTLCDGSITEWYPRLSPFRADSLHRRPASGQVNSSIRWAEVEILPTASPALSLPRAESSSHYFAARETEAATLRVSEPDRPHEYEKFLFYRGVSGFVAPLRVRQNTEFVGATALHNQGKAPFGPCFLYALYEGQAVFNTLPMVEPGITRDLNITGMPLRPAAQVQRELAILLRKALVQAGLFPREAAAMVKTWEASWLRESGARVLYVLPADFALQVLPLRIAPEPRELKRVFVGRAELITPTTEWSLLRQVARYADGTAEARAAAVEGVRKLALGRFLDAAWERAARFGPDGPDFRRTLGAIRRETTPLSSDRVPIDGSERTQ